jgi:hypothetical protein
MLVYHACSHVLEPGCALALKPNTHYEGMPFPTAERLLEQERPIGCHSRLSSYFAARSPEQALVVKHGMAGSDGEAAREEIRVYAVEAEKATPCPMILVQTVHVLLESGAEACGRRVARAYWTSDQPWYFVELLAPTLRVVRQIVMDRPFNIIWREVNDAYKGDKELALPLVRGLR